MTIRQAMFFAVVFLLCMSQCTRAHASEGLNSASPYALECSAHPVFECHALSSLRATYAGFGERAVKTLQALMLIKPSTAGQLTVWLQASEQVDALARMASDGMQGRGCRRPIDIWPELATEWPVTELDCVRTYHALEARAASLLLTLQMAN